MDPKVILLVEDNLSDVNLAKRAFDKNHVSNELVVARDGQEALDYLFGTGAFSDRKNMHVPALILLDLKLPKVDGMTVLKKIKTDETMRMIPVVMLTSSNEEIDLKACYGLGVNSYIRKPVDFSQFANTVSQLGLYWLVLNEPPPTRK